jgi:hypothetical protein
MVEVLGGLDESDHAVEATRDYGFDQFPKTFAEFRIRTDRILAKHLGPGWRHFIARGWNIPMQRVEQLFRKFWDGHWTLYETVNELMAIYDVAQGDWDGYEHMIDPKNRTTLVPDDEGGHVVVRHRRPMSPTDAEL